MTLSFPPLCLRISFKLARLVTKAGSDTKEIIVEISGLLPPYRCIIEDFKNSEFVYRLQTAVEYFNKTSTEFELCEKGVNTGWINTWIKTYKEYNGNS